MWKLIGGLLAGLVIGAAAGFAGGIFAYPFLFLGDVVAGDAAPATATLAEGGFAHANPSDPIHYGRGRVRIHDGVLHLASDFEVGPGPKVNVYLVPVANVTTDTDVAATMFVDLGRLRAFKGSQNYPLPTGLDLRRYGSVVIWCEPFGVLISPATLRHL